MLNILENILVTVNSYCTFNIIWSIWHKSVPSQLLVFLNKKMVMVLSFELSLLPNGHFVDTQQGFRNSNISWLIADIVFPQQSILWRQVMALQKISSDNFYFTNYIPICAQMSLVEAIHSRVYGYGDGWDLSYHICSVLFGCCLSTGWASHLTHYGIR